MNKMLTIMFATVGLLAEDNRVQPGTPRVASETTIAPKAIVSGGATKVVAQDFEPHFLHKKVRGAGKFIARHPKLFAFAIGAGVATAVVATGGGPVATPMALTLRGICSDPNPRTCGISLGGVGGSR